MSNLNIFYEFYDSTFSSWTDISSYVLGDVIGFYGMANNDQVDRVSSIGQMNLTLNNNEGKFLPGTPNCLSGFDYGSKIRLRIEYSNISFIRFLGHISLINIDAGTFGKRTVSIVAYDWFDYANNEEVNISEIKYNQKINEGVNYLVSLMEHEPESTDFFEGDDIFPTLFDNVVSGGKVIGEFQKLALSELSYIYLKHDNDNRLVVENRNKRNSNSELTSIPVAPEFSLELLTEDGYTLLQENLEPLLLNQIQTIIFDNNFIDAEIDHGNNLSNKVIVRSYPRLIDSTNQILYSLSDPISLNAGELKEEIKVFYRDPDQKAKIVSGSAMIPPIATTDYEMFANNDGTGTDLTANLNITVNFETNSALITLENTSGTSGYVTKLNLRGKSILTYDYVDVVKTDTTSISKYGYKELLIDQKYQPDIFSSTSVGQSILNQGSDPRTKLNKIGFLTSTEDLKHVFLYHNIGDLIYVKESGTGIDQSYYIQGVSFKTMTNGKIYFGFLLKEALSLGSAFWYLGTVGQSELGTTTILGY